jgi:hypothetical protein
VLYRKNEYVRRFIFSISHYSIQYRGFRILKWAMVLRHTMILLAHYFRFVGLELTRRILGSISMFILRREKPIQLIYGTMKENVLGVRIFLLWEKGCQFTSSDLMFISEYFKESEIGSCLVVNCECQDFSSHVSLLDISQLVVVRKNIGYDWGGYRDALILPQIVSANFVTLMNNSVLLNSPNLEWLKRQELLAIKCEGVSGAVESAYPIPHLQSFSLTISQKALASGLAKWLRDMKYSNNKFYVVRKYEIGLSKELDRLGIKFEALLPCETFYSWAIDNWSSVLGEFANHPSYQKILLLMHNDLSINPSHALWKFIQLRGIDITKKELVRKNPLQLPDIFK